MFFLGILIGVGVYSIILFIWSKFNNIGWSMFGLALLVCLLFECSSQLATGAIFAVVGLFLVGYFVGKNKKETPPIVNWETDELALKKESRYKSHCWYCGNPIDSNWNKKCPDCNKYYICPKCGACKCDFPKSPPFKH